MDEKKSPRSRVYEFYMKNMNLEIRNEELKGVNEAFNQADMKMKYKDLDNKYKNVISEKNLLLIAMAVIFVWVCSKGLL